MKKSLVLLLAVTMAVSALSGCGQKPLEETQLPVETQQSMETYTATAQGFGGEVKVELTLAGNKLTAVDVQGDKETAGIGSTAVEELPGKMLAANSVAVDSISGATVTSTAVLAAAADALSQSGTTLAANAVERKTTYEDADTDVVVVGGGIAGMSAAMVLADGGKNVILLEKTDLLGGAATVSHSAIWAIGSQFTKDVSDFTAEDIYAFFDKQAGPVYSKEVFYALANESHNSLQFLVENGVVFNDVAQCNPQANPRFWYATSENFGVGMMAKLNESYAARAIDTRTSTAAVELVRGGDGTVTGVVAECGGQKYTITADQVILATGGYGQNPEMMREYMEGYDYLVSNSTVAGATGDGHSMSIAAGGYIVGFGSMGVGSSLNKMDPVTFGDALLVNLEGEKVGPANEHYTKLYEVNVAQSNGETYSIYPSDIANYSNGGTLEVMEEYYQTDSLYKADTIEELAAQMGINAGTLAETVAVHNEHCVKGEGDEFNTPVDAMVPIVNGPFYGMVHRAGTIGTIAGPAVDEDMRVIREDGSVITNLYAVGELTYGNWFNGNYPMSGTGLGGCVSGGRLAAADILSND